MDVVKDGRQWRIGTRSDVEWIATGIVVGRTIAATIPPVFAAYATFYEPDGDEPDDEGRALRLERAVLRVLVDHTPAQPWWLGFLDTGVHDVVFPAAPRVPLYFDWPYVVVAAGPEPAITWRRGHMRSGDGALPDLMFPADRSWLVSALWDDTWTCVGGSRLLVGALAADPEVNARRVTLDEDAAPPGHEAC